MELLLRQKLCESPYVSACVMTAILAQQDSLIAELRERNRQLRIQLAAFRHK